MVGRTISHYSVLSKIAQGGMGVVYKAEDIRLRRTVALKFLSNTKLSDPEDKKRFLREAQAAACLDHPNIATVHEVDEVDGQMFIAMAFVDGPTVAELIQDRRLRFDEVIDIAIQTCRALQAAHLRGIIHRDVKSSNVMLNSRGEVRLTDFGLARLASSGSMSQTGVIRGTPAFMSPEQIQSRAIDNRTDVWSLGVMLYEMAAGVLPFEAEYEHALVYSIVHEKPQPLRSRRPDVPESFARLVHKALEKDPRRRYSTMQAMENELRAIQLEHQIASGSVEPREGSSVLDRVPYWAMLLALVVVVLGGASVLRISGWGRNIARQAAEPMKILPLTSYPGREEFASFSPDGKQVVFSWNRDAGIDFDVYAKLLDSPTPLRLTHDPRPDLSPAWAPDGRQIAFLRDLEGDRADLMLIPPLGGVERRLTSVLTSGWEGLAWSPDSESIVVVDRDGPREPPHLTLVSVATGEKKLLLNAPPEAATIQNPAFSPDGRQLAFAVNRSSWLGDIFVADAAGGGIRKLTSKGGRPEGIAWSRDGAQVLYSRFTDDGRRTLLAVPSQGGQPQPLIVGDNPSQPAFDFAGGRLIYSKRQAEFDIRRIEVGPDAPPGELFLSSTQIDANPQFSPDGSKVALTSNRGGSFEIWVANADGSNPYAATSIGAAGSPRWSPDGQWIVFDATVDDNPDIYAINFAGGPPRRITRSPSDDVVPAWSRDGRWLYFSSTRSGRLEIWKLPSDADTDSAALQLTHGGGIYGMESADGAYLYYSQSRSFENQIWRVPVGGGSEELVLDGISSGWGNWVVVDDGLFLIARSETESGGRVWNLGFFDFHEMRVKQIAPLRGRPTRGGPGLSVSPDRRLFLVGQLEVTSDLFLVENLH